MTDPWKFNLFPSTVAEDEPVTPAYLVGQYQRVLNSKVQIEISTSDETTTFNAVDQNGKPITLKDTLGRK